MSIEDQASEALDNAQAAEESNSEEMNSDSANQAEENAEESEASEDQDTQSEEGEDQDQEDKDNQEGDRKPKKNGFKKRIDRLNRKVSEAELERDYWKREAMKRGGEEKPKTEESQYKAANEEPNPDDFKTNAEYIRAVTKWELAQRDIQSQEQSSKAEAQKRQSGIQSEYNTRLDQFKAATSDFDDVLENFVEEHGGLNASQEVVEALMTSDLGPNVLYEVMKTPGEYERLSKLSSNAAVIRELGKIEARIAAKIASSKTQAKVSKAPAPASPVGRGSAGSPKSLSDPNISFAEYEKIRMQQLKNKK